MASKSGEFETGTGDRSTRATWVRAAGSGMSTTVVAMPFGGPASTRFSRAQPREICISRRNGSIVPMFLSGTANRSILAGVTRNSHGWVLCALAASTAARTRSRGLCPGGSRHPTRRRPARSRWRTPPDPQHARSSPRLRRRRPCRHPIPQPPGIVCKSWAVPPRELESDAPIPPPPGGRWIEPIPARQRACGPWAALLSSPGEANEPEVVEPRASINPAPRIHTKNTRMGTPLSPAATGAAAART
jgi:hypothetical protein